MLNLQTDILPLVDLFLSKFIKDANSSDFTPLSTDFFIILAFIFYGDGFLNALSLQDSGLLLQEL
jgi:hypothetical protein